MSERLPMSGNQIHECTKLDCYFCQKTATYTRPIVVMKPVLASGTYIMYDAWTSEEDELLRANCLLPIAELELIVTTRTRKAIIARRSNKHKEWNIEYISREWRWQLCKVGDNL